MKKKLSLVILILVSTLLFALPTLADTKPAPSNTMPNMDMSSSPSSTPSTSTPSLEGQYQVSVESTPEKLTPNQPVNFMITVKNKATGQPVLDASVNVNMMLMDVSTHSSMPGMSSSSETTLQGQAKLDNMEPGMYTITLSPTKQGEWTQEIHISSPTLGEATVIVPLTVTKSGPNWILIGSVGGFVVLAGIFAQILKRKQGGLK